jgi:hypothetical protein
MAQDVCVKTAGRTPAADFPQRVPRFVALSGRDPTEKNLSDDQHIASHLWNPKIYCRVHEIPSLDRNISQLNPVHALFCKAL